MCMTRRQWLNLSAATLGGPILAWRSTALAQGTGYPSKPIRLVVSAPPAGAADIVGRLLAQHMAQSFGQPVVVENRPGASAMIAANVVAKSAPDGYSILIASTKSPQIVSLYRRLPFDFGRDLIPVSLIAKVPTLLVVSNRIQANSFAELLALAKTRPGEISMGSGGTGSGGHLAGEFIKIKAGVNMVHVPYKGNGPLLNDLIAGQIDCAYLDLATVSGYDLASSRFRVLAVTGTHRAKAIPLVPTFGELGYQDLQRFSGGLSLFLPTGTPSNVVGQIVTEVRRIVRLPVVSDRLVKLGMQPVGSTPDELASEIRIDAPFWADLIRTTNIKLD